MSSVVGESVRGLVVALTLCLLLSAGAAVEHPAQSVAAFGLCHSTAPIPARELAGGLAAGCPLTGRIVRSGPVEVEVPPPGVTVAADGMARSGAGPSLVVSNQDGVVAAGSDADTASSATTMPSDCASSQYVLEDGGHPWRTTISWKLRKSSIPRRIGAAAVVSRLKAAFAAWRYDRNDCGLGGQPKRLRDSYGGWTSTPTGIGVRNGNLTCGSFNRTNTVEMGPLPSNLLGWTCYWWGNGGSMIAFDTRLESSTDLVLTLPRSCRNKWDLQSVATHEFGHAIGLGHVGNAAQTMHGVAPACSTAPRTLGRGDRLGLKRLYGLT